MPSRDPMVAFEKAKPDFQKLRTTVVRRLEHVLKDASLPTVTIQSRVKEADSLQRKLARQAKDSTLGDIDDIVGVRAIFFYPDDVARALTALEECGEFQIHELIRHDYHAQGGDRFGYSGIHVIVSPTKWPKGNARPRKPLRAEIQLRTLPQHAWASHSHKHHYKRPAPAQPTPMLRRLARLAALLEIADDEFAALDREAVTERERARRFINEGKLDQLLLKPAVLEVYLEECPDTLKPVAATAIKAGFESSDKTGQVSSFIVVAEAAGVVTLDRFAELVAVCAEREDALLELCREARREKFRPAALPLDVLTFLLAVDHSEAQSVFASLDYAPAMRKAVPRVGRTLARS